MRLENGTRHQWKFTKPANFDDLPPRHKKVIEGLNEMNVLDRWMYVSHALNLLSRFKATGKSAWEIVRLERSTLMSPAYAKQEKNARIDNRIKISDPVMSEKTGLPRLAGDWNPGIMKPGDGVLHFGGYITKSGVLQALTELKFSFGAHGMWVKNEPIQGFPFNYVVVHVDDWESAFRFRSQYNSRREVKDPHLELYFDPSPHEAVVPWAEYARLMGEKAPDVSDLPTAKNASAIARIKDDLSKLIGLLGEKGVEIPGSKPKDAGV